MSNNCCIEDNKDACNRKGIPDSCNMGECSDDLDNNSKFCCSKKATFGNDKYTCEPDLHPQPAKIICANSGEDITDSDKFKHQLVSCCDGQEPVSNICPKKTVNSGNKNELKVLLGILIFCWFVTLGVFIYTKYKLGK